jgi:RNA polymerase sigma-70 factor (ECF subfamily)
VFCDIYREYFEYVSAALLHLGVSEADLMDLTQAVFLVVHVKLPTFEGRAEIATWLFSICRRTASSYRRKARFRREAAWSGSEIEHHWALERNTVSVEALMARRGLREQVQAILNRLPEAQRVVFVMSELEELTGPEIAKTIGIPVGTVRSRLRLARATFERLGRQNKL